MSTSNTTLIGPEHWELHQIQALLHQQISLSPHAVHNINTCRQYLDKKLQDPKAIYYGINTGFGSLCNVAISASELSQLQYNLIVSHACGTGNEVPVQIVKLILLLKIKNFCYGHSGVSLSLVQRLVDMYNHNVLPIIFTQGSLGASGDLAPLAHLSLPLLGQGGVHYKGKRVPAADVLQQLGWKPLALKSKEGLALLNGTQFMSAYAVYCLLNAQKLLLWANTIGALSADAWLCLPQAFDADIQGVRKHQGQIDVATFFNKAWHNSDLMQQAKSQVQDPYSFRCIPQVHGACADALAYVSNVILNEVNAVTDNPLIYPEHDKIISGGNFHGEPLALALDHLKLAVAELASISERRTYLLISGQRGLPPYLTKNAGVQSGLMITQYTAASIVSANKQLCTPASVDSIVSSNGQEDHVSMGANAATQCHTIVHNTYKVLAIEILNASQAMHLRAPVNTSPALQNLLKTYRGNVSPIEQDRWLAVDIDNSEIFLLDYPLHQWCNKWELA
jgi:histidine ammonia-lyase